MIKLLFKQGSLCFLLPSVIRKLRFSFVMNKDWLDQGNILSLGDFTSKN